MIKSEIKKSKERCYDYRKKLLDISQKVISVHIGGAFSSFEIMDFIFFKLKTKKDKFILSKGHAAIGLYILLCKIGVLKKKIYSFILQIVVSWEYIQIMVIQELRRRLVH